MVLIDFDATIQTVLCLVRFYRFPFVHHCFDSQLLNFKYLHHNVMIFGYRVFFCWQLETIAIAIESDRRKHCFCDRNFFSLLSEIKNMRQ